MRELRFVWLEITGKCQLQCVHCYAGSGPRGTDGAMALADWTRVIDESAQLGGRMVQFIGGEPTLHRHLPELVNHALRKRMDVEVFSNLVQVTPRLWEVFAQRGVRLATSYYTSDPSQHASITRYRGSHARTRGAITEALRRSIPLRVGLIDIHQGRGIDRAHAELVAMGVRDIEIDRVRNVGRGARDNRPDMEQLCGGCGQRQVAVAPDGAVWPCVFARWMTVGNVRRASLPEIIGGTAMTDARRHLDVHFRRRVPSTPCVPNMCDPQCGPSCSPACRPQSNCRPVGACVPTEY